MNNVVQFLRKKGYRVKGVKRKKTQLNSLV